MEIIYETCIPAAFCLARVFMKLSVKQIPENSGYHIQATAPQSEWFKEILERALGGFWNLENEADLSLDFTRIGRSVSMQGDIHIPLTLSCDRCLGEFAADISLEIAQEFAPIEEEIPYKKEKEYVLSEEDLRFSYYSGNQIEISQVVYENILLEKPIQFLCDENCRGLCTQCGKNRNSELCHCNHNDKGNPFAALKKLSLNR